MHNKLLLLPSEQFGSGLHISYRVQCLPALNTDVALFPKLRVGQDCSFQLHQSLQLVSSRSAGNVSELPIAGASFGVESILFTEA